MLRHGSSIDRRHGNEPDRTRLPGRTDIIQVTDHRSRVGSTDRLPDESHRRIERRGDTVRRPLHPWSPAVHELLRYLESVDFPARLRRMERIAWSEAFAAENGLKR
jgi:hypothetical protein